MWRARIRNGLVVRPLVGIEGQGTRHHFYSANWQSGGMQFPTERIVVGVCAMVCLGVRVGCGAHRLEIGFGERWLVLGQWSGGGPASSEDKESANAEGEARKFASFHERLKSC